MNYLQTKSTTRILIKTIFNLLIFSSAVLKGCIGELIVTVDKNEIFSKVGDSISISYRLEDNSGPTAPQLNDNSKIEVGVDINGTLTLLATITLKTSDNPLINIESINGDAVRLSYKNRINLSYSNNQALFKLNNLVNSDFARLYQLEYQYTTFKRPKKAVLLTKAVKPDINKATFFPTTKQIIGRDITYPCIAQGKPTPQVKWTQKGELRAEGQGFANLVIKNAQLEDADKFICTATNAGGVTQKSMTLTVAYIELKGVQMKTISIPKRGSIRELCEVNGYPQPEYKWFDPNNKVIETENLLNFANNEDFGNYTCQAENFAGKVNFILQVTLKDGATTTAATSKGDGETSGAKFIEASIFIVFIIYLLSILSMGLI